MSHGSERKMTLPEFVSLINKAYSFLKVTFPEDLGQYIFNTVDGDKDGLITYVEYFKVIELFICKGAGEASKVSEPVPPVNNGPERHSRLRKYIWLMLRKLYEAYVQGRSLLVNDVELKGLLFAIVGDLSGNEVTFIATGLHGLNFKTIEFDPFAERFIYLIAELGLSRWAANRESSKRTLDRDEFVRLLKNTFSFLKLDNFKNSILYKIFEKIDKNHDELISYD